MGLLYGFLVAGVGIAVGRTRNEALIKIFSVIFVGWLVYVNFHPYGTEYSRVFNLVLDSLLLTAVLLTRRSCLEVYEKRSLWGVAGLFIAMLINHVVCMVIDTPPTVYYWLYNALFFLQLMLLNTYAIKCYRGYQTKPATQETKQCQKSLKESQDLKVVCSRPKAA